MDVLEAAPSTDDVSGACWDCRWRSPWERDDRVEGMVLDFDKRAEDLPELARLI